VFFFLSKLLDVFLSPYTWGLMLVGIAISWRRPRPGKSWKRRRALGIAGLGMLLFFGSGRVSNALLYRLEHATTSSYQPDVVYDAVVLLGGVSDERVLAETGLPTYNDNVERLIMTHRLLAQGRARFAIVSGAATTPALAPFGEARALGAQLEEWGIASGRVILEEKARNTRENAVFTRDILRERGFRSVLVVTSAFHMRRALECFAAVDVPVDSFAVDYRSSSSQGAILPRVQFLNESTMVLRETAGLYVYRLQGYAKPR
jgi:uncharacterized SAM-binding protein YcdF (DUF218 family)